jgi:hypothetical protein
VGEMKYEVRMTKYELKDYFNLSRDLPGKRRG